MGTVSCIRNQTKQGTWSDIFPHEQVTLVQSSLFVKKLVAVAVSSISYLRAIFPEDAFGDRCLEDINLKILRENSICPGASQVIQWVKGCFDAIDKKYLKTILVGIYENPEDPDTVIEQYTFKFSYENGESVGIYHNNSKITSAHSEAETKKATIRLLRTIILLSQTLSPLPDDVMMTMKLLYDDELTPADYQPPGFTDCSNENFEFNEEPMKLRIGEVSTPFHELKLRIATTCHQLQYKEAGEEKQAEEKSANTCDRPEPTEDLHVSLKESEMEMPNQPNQAITCESTDGISMTDGNDLIAEEEMLASPEHKTDAVPVDANPSSCASAASAHSEPITVCCPCDVNEDDGLMILCAICATWQHAICFGILDAEEAPTQHLCIECYKGGNHEDSGPTDGFLVKLEAGKLKEVCLWRRTLLAVCETSRVLAPSLAKRLGVETSFASYLIERLEKEGYLKSNSRSKRLGKLVMKAKIEDEAIPKYFKQGIEEREEAIDVSTKNIDAIVSKASSLKLDELEVPEEKPRKETGRKEKENLPTPMATRRKRAVSKTNQEHEFELNDSQEVTTDSRNPSKRRKTSIAKKSILV